MTAGPVGGPRGLVDELVLPGGLARGEGGEGRGGRGRWGWRLGALLFWGTVQGVFLLVPPAAGIAVNVAVAAGFVWWWVLRPAARANGRRRAALRLRPIPAGARAWLPAAAAALVAFVLASLVVLPRLLDMPRDRTTFLDAYLERPLGVVAVLVMVAVIAPLLEEFAFRGWLQRALERREGRAPADAPWRAIGLTALLFAAVHLDAFGFPLRLAFGVASGYAARATRSIWPSVVLHGAYNGALVVVGTLVPELDERTLTAWAHTPRIFWPAVAAVVASGAALAGALGAMRRATPHAGERVRARAG